MEEIEAVASKYSLRKMSRSTVAEAATKIEQIDDSTTPSQLAGKNTRNKKIDFSKLGEKKSISNSSCHKCKTMIPVNEENFCKAGLIEISTKKSAGLA